MRMSEVDRRRRRRRRRRCQKDSEPASQADESCTCCSSCRSGQVRVNQLTLVAVMALGSRVPVAQEADPNRLPAAAAKLM